MTARCWSGGLLSIARGCDGLEVAVERDAHRGVVGSRSPVGTTWRLRAFLPRTSAMPSGRRATVSRWWSGPADLTDGGALEWPDDHGLDRVRGPRRFRQRGWHTETVDREGLRESFGQRRGRAGVRRREGPGDHLAPRFGVQRVDVADAARIFFAMARRLSVGVAFDVPDLVQLSSRKCSRTSIITIVSFRSGISSVMKSQVEASMFGCEANRSSRAAMDRADSSVARPTCPRPRRSVGSPRPAPTSRTVVPRCGAQSSSSQCR